MEAVLPTDPSQETFSLSSLPSEPTLTLQSPDFTKDLISLGSAKTTPKSTDQTPTNAIKENSHSKLARWRNGKSVSLTSAGLSELQESCLENITTRSEDLRGKLDSPKLSAKMQMVFTSNVSLSENIIRNTVRAVDDSCIKLENKDLQVELELSELKLQHLEKKVEGCLASSKSTLALNTQVSENVSRMVSPQKSPHELKAKSISQANTQRGDGTLSPKTLQKGLNRLLNEEIENMERMENVYQNRSKSPQKTRESASSISSSGAKEKDLRFKQFPFDNQENAQGVLSKGLKVLEKYMDVSPLGEKSLNFSNETNSQRRESNQKLRSYFEAHSGVNKAELKDIESATVESTTKNKQSGKFAKAIECTFNNNITFQNSVTEKDTQLGSDTKRKDNTKNTERNSSIEDSSRTFGSRTNIIISSRTSSINIASILEGESKRSNFRREIIVMEEDGKEKVYVIKPKETLSIQKLETVCVDFSKEEKIFFSTQELKTESNVNNQNEWGQLDSIQLRAIEECNDNSARSSSIMGHKTPYINSERNGAYDNSYIVSLNLDKQEKDKNDKLSVFGQKAKFFDQDQQKTAVYKMEDLSFNNLRLNAVNNSEAMKEEQSLNGGLAAICNRWEKIPLETDRPESLLKQKISDFRNFLNEFEDAISSEPLLSPLVKPTLNENKLKQQRNPNTSARSSMEVKNIDLKFEKQDFCTQEFDNTPKIQYTGRTEEGVTSIRKDSKQKLQHQLSDKSPKAIRAFSDREFETQRHVLQNGLPSPLSNNKNGFSLTKNNLNHSNSGVLKTRFTENDEETNKGVGSAVKAHKFSRTLSTTAFLNSGSIDTTKDTTKKKTLSSSKLLKSTDRMKIDADIKAKAHVDTLILQNNNIKCRKTAQKGLAGPRIEVVVLGKGSKRTNSLIEK